MGNFTLCEDIVTNMARAVVGKRESLELLLVGLLAEGHVLIEDVPGLGKTLIAKALASSISGTFKRVQFTPDLLPSDVTGYSVYNQQVAQFQLQPGPVVTNVLLADEINRTIPRTQASLLESMEERQVTIDGRTQKLPAPFFVIATQNPIELEGTFPLPEAQLDRFLLRLSLGYPTPAEELIMLQRFQREDPLPSITPVATPEQVIALQHARREIEVSSALQKYIVDLVAATRKHEALRFGVSPRGSLALMRAAQALAALRGRSHVLPDDVKHLARPVLAHRLSVKSAERLRGVTAEHVLAQVLETTAVL
ncbi:MAG TPA: AAA family ATPase [Polyangiales bacterium]|nr:AAA family ATPase [Polyangiales bacterium]